MDTATQVPQAMVVASEAIQRSSWRMLSRAASPDLAETLGIRVKEVGSTLYQGAQNLPGLQFNKVFSFGIDEDFSSGAIENASEWLRNHCPARSMIWTPQVAWQHELDQRMLRHGLHRFPIDIAIFQMDVADMPEVSGSTTIDVRPVSSENAALFGRVLSEGLAQPAAAEWLAAFAVGQPGLTAYLAYDGSTAVGAAALLVEGDWGWLFIAAVRPAYRNRGAQTAMLARRLLDGRKAGVRTFTVGSVSPPPGQVDGFASFRNIQRAGFKFAYNRPNFVASA